MYICGKVPNMEFHRHKYRTHTNMTKWFSLVFQTHVSCARGQKHHTWNKSVAISKRTVVVQHTQNHYYYNHIYIDRIFFREIQSESKTTHNPSSSCLPLYTTNTKCNITAQAWNVRIFFLFLVWWNLSLSLGKNLYYMQTKRIFTDHIRMNIPP